MDLVVEFLFILTLNTCVDGLMNSRVYNNVLLVFLFSILGQKIRNFTAPNWSIVGSSDFL